MAAPLDGADNVRTFPLGPLTLHVTSRPFRFSVLEAGRPLLAERARREGGSLELRGEDGWRRVADAISIRAGDPAAGHPASGVVAVASIEGGGSVEIRFEWSATRGGPTDPAPGALEVSYAAAGSAFLEVREDFVTLPDEALLLLGPARDGPAAGRRLILSPRFALLAGARRAAAEESTVATREKAETPRVFAPDPDALRIQAAGSTLLLDLVPGRPRETLERIRRAGDAAGQSAPRATPLLWIDARSLSTPPDAERVRSLLDRVSIREATGLIVEKDAAASFRLASGEALAPPAEIVIDGWQALREAAAPAIETAVLGSGPRVLHLPPGSSGAGGLAARSMALALLQPAVALRWDLLSACAGDGPVDATGLEAVRIARRLLRVRSALGPVITDAASASRGWNLVPLFVEHPEEEGAWSARDEWLLGRDVLVAPVLEEGATGRTVYFPAGTWRDLRPSPAGAAADFRGPGRHRVEIREGEVGLFGREGGDPVLAARLAKALRGE
jgi:hypothetical protein